MRGKICLISGATSGHGRAVAEGLAGMGATVVIGCRNPERAEAARARLISRTGNDRVFVLPLDLASLSSVREAADRFLSEFETLDVLINNAGAWWADRRTSSDGLEMVWATNVVGPYYLTQLLTPALRRGDGARVVNVASSYASGLDLDDVQWTGRKYSGVQAYQASKQAVRMLTWTAAEQFAGTNVAVNAICPGFMTTNLGRSAPLGFRVMLRLTRPLQTSPEIGADTAIWLASSPEADGVTNQFLAKRTARPCAFRDPAARERLAKLCEQAVANGADAKLGD